MQELKKHIVFKIVSTLIVLILLAPATIKLVHSFEHHEHNLCEKTDVPNFHKCELDCTFYKYNLQQYCLKTQNYNLSIFLVNNFEIPSSTYQFFYSSYVLSGSLRGPPVLV